MRIIAGSQGDGTKARGINPSLEYELGKYDEDLWRGFDFVLDYMNKKNMKAIIAL